MAILAQLVDDVVVHRFELATAGHSVGRHPDNDIVINDSAVSAKHARIDVRPNPDFPAYQEIYIEDLQSTNGTFVNDVQIHEVQRLYDQDVVRIAWNQFRLIDPQQLDKAKTVHMV